MKKNIKIEVDLDNNHTPKKMHWSADDGQNQAPQECKAMLLSVFDATNKDTLKIDLWTTEMQVQEMDRFFYQTLKAMSQTYFNATKNDGLANQMRQFAEYFGEKTEIVPKKE